MGQIIRIRKKNWGTGVTRRYEYKGVRYEVSSAFRPFILTGDDDTESGTDGMKDKFVNLMLRDPELTMKIKGNKICTMYSNLSAGKECNADKV